MYSEIARNKRRTWFIMLLFVVIIGALGWIVGEIYRSPVAFVSLAFVIGALYALIQYFAAAKLALATNGAHQVSKQEEPRLYRTVENLTIATGLPMPKVYVIEDPAPNAFATGRDPNHSVVCATRGLLDMMNDSELEGVLAHELGHVKNYDIRVMMIVFGLVSAIGLIANIMMNMFWWGGRDEERSPNPIFIVLGLVAAILAPLAASLVQLAVSRRREYLADSTGAMTTRYPEGLASALEKIRDSGSALRKQNTATAHLFFANPLRGHALANLFSTHPPIEDRIARLRGMETKV